MWGRKEIEGNKSGTSEEISPLSNYSAPRKRTRKWNSLFFSAIPPQNYNKGGKTRPDTHTQRTEKIYAHSSSSFRSCRRRRNLLSLSESNFPPPRHVHKFDSLRIVMVAAREEKKKRNSTHRPKTEKIIRPQRMGCCPLLSLSLKNVNRIL